MIGPFPAGTFPKSDCRTWALSGCDRIIRYGKRVKGSVPGMRAVGQERSP